MKLRNDAYESALIVFEQAVAAFSRGEIEEGARLLASLDRHEIERDRAQLREFARTARSGDKRPTDERGSRTIPDEIKEAVQLRDRYHCRFTARRLIELEVFHEVSRISKDFHFDTHHSVRQTSRGPAGHPLVRTHGAAYEHVEPHSCGGVSSIGNILLTSVQLNESKGAKLLPQVDVPEDNWNGMTEYLPGLRRQEPASGESTTQVQSSSPADGEVIVKPSSARTDRAVSRIREGASGIQVTVFALGDDPCAEQAFKAHLRSAKSNSYFATQTKQGIWMIHKLNCSSLSYKGEPKLTARPKVCAAEQKQILEWAEQFGVVTTECKRCRKVK